MQTTEVKHAACCSGSSSHASSAAAPAAARLGVSADGPTFVIPTMDCASEESEIRGALQSVAGITGLRFQLGARTLQIQAPEAALAEALAAIRKAGFSPKPLSEPTADSANHGIHEAPPAFGSGIRRLVIALVLALAAEVLSFLFADSLPVKISEFALAAGAIWLAGIETYKKGWTALRHRRLNINALMSVAITGAFLIGEWPEAAMVMALFAIAELIEARSLDRARNAIRSLMALSPEEAEVRQPDGSWLTVPAAGVALEAIVRIRPGERVPLDGVITKGASAINQAPVTGESIPVDKTVGDPVFAGTVNETAALEFRITAEASNTTLARIIHAVEQAQSSRAETQRFVDRFAAIYTPAVFVLAVGVAVLTPTLMGWTWLEAVYKALVLLVIACPCALVISTPVTIVSALANAARRGILIKGGTFLEKRAQSEGDRFRQDGNDHRRQAQARGIYRTERRRRQGACRAGRSQFGGPVRPPCIEGDCDRTRAIGRRGRRFQSLTGAWRARRGEWKYVRTR